MTTGELIKKYRKSRGLTQVQLAEACGLTDSGIRNYELGNRTPGEELLNNIAKALDIAPEALIDVEADSAQQIMHLLFRIAESTGAAPIEMDGENVIAFDRKNKMSKKVEAAMKAWRRQIQALQDGEISQDEYDLWLASFKA